NREAIERGVQQGSGAPRDSRAHRERRFDTDRTTVHRGGVDQTVPARDRTMGRTRARGRDQGRMTNLIDKTHGVRVKRAVRYATARVNVSTKPAERELLLDVYQPEDLAAGTPSPPLVLASGGRLHPGSPARDPVDAEATK